MFELCCGWKCTKHLRYILSVANQFQRKTGWGVKNILSIYIRVFIAIRFFLVLNSLECNFKCKYFFQYHLHHPPCSNTLFVKWTMFYVHSSQPSKHFGIFIWRFRWKLYSLRLYFIQYCWNIFSSRSKYIIWISENLDQCKKCEVFSFYEFERPHFNCIICCFLCDIIIAVIPSVF